jgi:hypothetical protein
VSGRHVTDGRDDRDRDWLGPITAAFTPKDPFWINGWLFIYSFINLWCNKRYFQQVKFFIRWVMDSELENLYKITVFVQFEAVALKYFEHWRKQQKPSVSRATYGPILEALISHIQRQENKVRVMYCDTWAQNEHRCKCPHVHKTRTKTMKYSYNVKDPTKQDKEGEIWRHIITGNRILS